MELEIKSCLDDFLNKNYLSKIITNIWNHVIVNQALCKDFIKITKAPQLIILYLLFDLFYQQLVPVTTTFQNRLYLYLNSLLLMNTLSKILFHFVKKFLTKYQIYLWHVLVFSHCSQKYPWMKRLIFVLIWFSMLKRHFKHLLTLSVKSSCFFLMMFIINRLMV